MVRLRCRRSNSFKSMASWPFLAGLVVLTFLSLFQPSNGMQDKDAISAEQHERQNLCREWATHPHIKKLIVAKSKAADHCACVEQKMVLDISYEKIDNCYRQWFFQNGLKQMCCYNEIGILLTGSPYGGYLLLESNEARIVDAHYNCCHDNDEETCSMFFATNPSDDCSKYEQNKQAVSWGDPVITTIDGHNFTFNGHGEYDFLIVNNGQLSIQARTDYWVKGKIDATIFVGFALFAADKINDSVTVLLNRTEKIADIYLNDGTRWTNTKAEKPPVQTDGFTLFCSPIENKIKIQFRQHLGNLTSISFTAGDFLSASIESRHSLLLPNTSGLAGALKNGSYVDRGGNGYSVSSKEYQMYNYSESCNV